MLFCAVVVDPLEEAVELFATRRGAELLVEDWNRDEPERAGELRVERSRSRRRRTEACAFARPEVTRCLSPAELNPCGVGQPAGSG